MPVDSDAQPSPTPPQSDGWVTSARQQNQGSVSNLSASFTVPSAPTLPNGQVVYFFPGLEPLSTGGNTILQPVLGWNQAGAGWSMSSWNCCVEGNVFNSGFTPVSAGDELNGSIDSFNCHPATGVCDNWQVETSDPAINVSTDLQTTSYGAPLDWIFGGVLEQYGVTDCGQLPANGFEKFTNVTTKIIGTGQVSFPWLNTGDGNVYSPDCHYGITSTPSTVTLTWSAGAVLTALPRAGWLASASSASGTDVPAHALDGSASTRYSSGVPQSSAATQTFTVDMLSAQTFSQLNLTASGTDFVHNYQVYASNSTSNWGTAIATGSASASPIVINFPQLTARYLQVRSLTAPGVGSWWSISELNVLGASGGSTLPPGSALPRAGWVASASVNSSTASSAIDGSTTTRWTSGSPQSNAATRTFLIDLQTPQTFAKIAILSNNGDYARSYQVYASNSSTSFGSPIASGTGTAATTTITVPQTTARYIQIAQTTSAAVTAWWSIADLNVYAP